MKYICIILWPFCFIFVEHSTNQRYTGMVSKSVVKTQNTDIIVKRMLNVMARIQLHTWTYTDTQAHKHGKKKKIENWMEEVKCRKMKTKERKLHEITTIWYQMLGKWTQWLFFIFTRVYSLQHEFIILFTLFDNNRKKNINFFLCVPILYHSYVYFASKRFKMAKEMFATHFLETITNIFSPVFIYTIFGPQKAI